MNFFAKPDSGFKCDFEFNESAWLHILPLRSCVTLDLSLNFSDLQCSHVTIIASQVCSEASGRSYKSCPPSLLLPAAFRSPGPSVA